MTATYNPAEVEWLAREGKAHAEAMGATAPECACNGAAFCEHWCPCYPWALAQGAGYDWCDANLRAMADQLEAARVRIAELETVARAYVELRTDLVERDASIVQLVAQRDEYQRQADQQRADMEVAQGELLISLDEMPPGSKMRHMMLANGIMRNQRADYRRQLDEAQLQLEAARAQVERIPDLQAAIGYEIDRRDAALLQLDVARARIAELEGELRVRDDQLEAARDRILLYDQALLRSGDA